MMGDVAVVMRILPEDADRDINAIMGAAKDRLKDKCTINKVEVQEVAFGLKAVRLEIIIPDEEGKIDSVEAVLSGIDGVGQVDTEDMTLV
jgi:elongation factor 1-beta